jgi:MFS family permease
MSVDTLQWAVTGYSLVGAAVIVTSGSLGDVFGRKRVFQAVASWLMAAFSFVGVLMAFVMARHRAAKGTLQDSAAAAAAHTNTLPTSATPAPAQAVANE